MVGQYGSPSCVAERHELWCNLCYTVDDRLRCRDGARKQTLSIRRLSDTQIWREQEVHDVHFVDNVAQLRGSSTRRKHGRRWQIGWRLVLPFQLREVQLLLHRLIIRKAYRVNRAFAAAGVLSAGRALHLVDARQGAQLRDDTIRILRLHQL